uniref:Galectin n=1 Tax=Panstrongylus lignarius TaxID=156445 RepID=A0A224XR93_9HEMI
MLPIKESDITEVDQADEAIEYDYFTDSEVYHISDSHVPYHHNLKNRLVVKSNILVNGFIPPVAQRFAIDLCSHSYDKCKNKKAKEIIFHFNPRFGQNCVVRNSHISGEWGHEEVHATKKNPFRRGQIFIMEIYVMKSEYLVSVNGVHFCSFLHRVHPSNVDSISITGDIELLKVELSKRDMYSSTERTILLVDDPYNKMKFPFYHELKYPIMEMWYLTITGTVLEYADRFAVDLCAACDKCTSSHKNIIFHLNPRLTQNYVARNSFLHERWGLEESHATQLSPFMRGQTFILKIFVTASKYMVSVNEKHFCSFEHRLPPSAVDSFEIHGDVAVKRIDIGRQGPNLNQLEMADGDEKYHCHQL